jgi:hypothetical protein
MIELNLISGSTTIALNDRTSRFLHSGYFPQVKVGSGKVTETVKLQARGDLGTIVQGLNRIFEKARSGNPSADKVYLQCKLNESASLRRARIYNGAVNLTNAVGAEIKKGRVTLDVSWERDPFWEGDEVSVPLSNANGTQVTTPLPVFNTNDKVGTAPAKRVNHVDIIPDIIVGDLPSPAKIKVQNACASTMGHLWAGMNNTRSLYPADSVIPYWQLEAESAIGVTPTASSAASGGYFVQGTMNYGVENVILKWDVSDTLINLIRGQRLRMLLRPWYTGAYWEFKYKLKITFGATSLFETDWIRESAEYARSWLEMFDFRLPPWLEGQQLLSGLRLELWATPTRSGTWTWAFDDVMVIPQDGFVTLDTVVPTSGFVMLDGIEGQNWAQGTDGLKFGLRKCVGSLFWLRPTEFHRLFFLWHGIIMNDADIEAEMKVQISYRPRYASL